MILESISLASYSPSLQLDIQTGKLTQTVSTTAYTFIKDLTTPVVPAGQTIVTDFLLCPIAKPIFIVRMSGKDYRIESSKAFEPGKRQTYEFTLQAKDMFKKNACPYPKGSALLPKKVSTFWETAYNLFTNRI